MAKIFKDLLGVDAAIIMSVTEFAEYLTVDGVLIACQFVPSTQKKSGVESRNYGGLYGDFATLYFKTDDYVKKRKKPVPAQGQFVYLEAKGMKKRFEVIQSEDELGVTCLTLSTYRQNTISQKNMALAKAGLI